MLSYKNWKNINESVFSTAFNLGVRPMHNIGLTSPTGFDIGETEPVEEQKKKKRVDVEETGDGEIVDAASEKDKPGSGGCGCSKCNKCALLCNINIFIYYNCFFFLNYEYRVTILFSEWRI